MMDENAAVTGYVGTRAAVDEKQLHALILASCGAPIYCYRQDVTAVHLTQFPEPFTPLAEGRAFGPKAEVRWQRQEEDSRTTYAVTLLTEDLPPEKGWETTEYEGVPQKIYLIGAWQPKVKAWVEVRLPHPLDYPLPGPENAQARLIVRAVEYRCRGIVQYIRFKGLQVETIKEGQA